MSPAQLEKRLAEVETYLAKRWPAPAPGHPEWFAWVTDDELTELDLMTMRWDTEGAEPTEIDRLRLAEVELAATRRMLSGAPSERDRPRLRAGATMSTDELLTAIEATSGDTKACASRC